MDNDKYLKPLTIKQKSPNIYNKNKRISNCKCSEYNY